MAEERENYRDGEEVKGEVRRDYPYLYSLSRILGRGMENAIRETSERGGAMLSSVCGRKDYEGRKD